MKLVDGPTLWRGQTLGTIQSAADPKERANQLLVPELKPLINYLLSSNYSSTGWSSYG